MPRRGASLGLADAAGYDTVRQATEDNLLADRLLAGELEKIRPTEVDIQSYYQAHQAQYRRPESLEALIEPLAADEDHTAVLAGIQSADDFRRLVQIANQDRRCVVLVQGTVRGGDPLAGPSGLKHAQA